MSGNTSVTDYPTENKQYKERNYPTPNIDSKRTNTVEGVILHHTAEPTIEPTKEIRDGLKISMHDGKYVAFSIYNSYKIQQITQFIINYIQNKRMDNTNMYS